MNYLPYAIVAAVALLASSVASPVYAGDQRARGVHSRTKPTNTPTLRPFVRGGDWLSGFSDSTGTVVIEPRFTFASGFADGRAVIRSGDGFGYIDARGRLVVPARLG